MEARSHLRDVRAGRRWHRRLARAGGAAALAVAVCAAGLDAQAAAVPRPVALAGSAVPFTSQTAALGDLSSARTLTIQMWLRPDMVGAQSYASAVSTPGDRIFRHFLSPDSYTARFGPSVQEVAAARAWLRAQGFTAVRADAQRDYVRATATVGRIDAAFRVTVRRYRATARASGGGAPLFANDRPLTVPASLAGDVLGVTGLDSAALTVPIRRAGLGCPRPPRARLVRAPATGGSTCSPACHRGSAPPGSPW